MGGFWEPPRRFCSGVSQTGFVAEVRTSNARKAAALRLTNKLEYRLAFFTSPCNICVLRNNVRWLTIMSEGFSKRLQETFGFATMATVAKRLGIPHATVRNYYNGRLPAPEVLIKIANETNVSLNWLLAGTGDMYAGEPKRIDIDEILDKRIEQAIERKLATKGGQTIQELGAVDMPPAFDIEAALRRSNDPHVVMKEWFKHEGRDYPQDLGIMFFQGWASYTERERLEAIRDAKKVLDRTLKSK